MPFGASTIESTSTADSANDDTLFIVPYDGSLEKIVIQNANTVANMGNTRMQLRVNGTNGTAVQVSMSNETTATFTFTTSNTFSAGDRIRISMSPVGGVAPKYVSASSVWKYTI